VSRNAVAIRRASLVDVPTMARLFDLYRQFYDMRPDESLASAFIRDRLAAEQSAIFVAESPDGEAVGFCQIYFSFCSVFAGPICILNDLFVLPRLRGAGVGAALLAEAEAFAAGTGALRITLQTAITNDRAQQLYETRGWTRNTTLYGYAKRMR